MERYIIPILILIAFILLGSTHNILLFWGVLFIVVAIFMWIGVISERLKHRIYESERKIYSRINQNGRQNSKTELRTDCPKSDEPLVKIAYSFPVRVKRFFREFLP